MESSRSGLLSTLIMTVPLIVVPAIALLRPPAPHSGLATAELEASADDDFFSGFDGIDGPGFGDPTSPSKKPADSDDSSDFSEIFEDHDALRADEGHSHGPERPELNTPQSNAPTTHPVDPFASELPSARRPEASVELPESSRPIAPDANIAPDFKITPDATVDSTLIAELTEMGVTRTLWFSPNVTSVGFVAFLTDHSIAGTAAPIQYRFEAIGTSRSDALRRVRDQIQRWRRGSE